MNILTYRPTSGWLKNSNWCRNMRQNLDHHSSFRHHFPFPAFLPHPAFQASVEVNKSYISFTLGYFQKPWTACANDYAVIQYSRLRANMLTTTDVQTNRPLWIQNKAAFLTGKGLWLVLRNWLIYMGIWKESFIHWSREFWAGWGKVERGASWGSLPPSAPSSSSSSSSSE